MFKKVLVDLHAEIDLPRPYWCRNIEALAKELEREARELTEFLRDHRSRDDYKISIIRKYMSRCEFCGLEEERDDDGVPVCCQRAIDEHNGKLIKGGIE